MTQKPPIKELSEMFPMVDKQVIGLILDENHFRMEPTIKALLEITQDLPSSEPPVLTLNLSVSEDVEKECDLNFPDTSGDEMLARSLQQNDPNEIDNQISEDEKLALKLSGRLPSPPDTLTDEQLAYKLQLRYDPNFAYHHHIATSGPGTIPGLMGTNVDLPPKKKEKENDDFFPDINLKEIGAEVEKTISEVDKKISSSLNELSDSMKSAWASFSVGFNSDHMPKETPQIPELRFRNEPLPQFNFDANIPQTLDVSVSDTSQSDEFSDESAEKPLLTA